MFTTVKKRAHIQNVIAYFDIYKQMYVMQLQIKYDRMPNPSRIYQLATFNFFNRTELERLMKDFKVSCGVKELQHIKEKEVFISLCTGKDDEISSEAELSSISIVGSNNQCWYPMATGILGDLTVYPMIFA